MGIFSFGIGFFFATIKPRVKGCECVPTVKLVGGFADGSVAHVADGCDEIFVPTQWGRQNYKGRVPMAYLRGPDGLVRYSRSGQVDDEGMAIFVAEGVTISP